MVDLSALTLRMYNKPNTESCLENRGEPNQRNEISKNVGSVATREFLKNNDLVRFRTRGFSTASLDAQIEPACGTGGVRCA